MLPQGMEALFTAHHRYVGGSDSRSAFHTVFLCTGNTVQHSSGSSQCRSGLKIRAGGAHVTTLHSQDSYHCAVEILSPYGKNPLHELHSVYHLGSFEALEALVRTHLQLEYHLSPITVLSAHIAFGLTVALECHGVRYYLKFWSSGNQPDLPIVFDYLEALVQNGIPAPHVLRRKDGNWTARLLGESVYDSAYLMRASASAGSVMDTSTVPRLVSLAQTMANWHRVGGQFSTGTHTDFSLEMQQHLPGILESLSMHPTAQAVGAWLFEHLEHLPSLPMIRTYGDFRLCHALFSGDRVSGVIDADISVIRTRLADLAQAAVSHPNPARCAMLEVTEVESLLNTYTNTLPLTREEQLALPVILLYAALEQWAESNRSDDARTSALVSDLVHRVVASA